MKIIIALLILVVVVLFLVPLIGLNVIFLIIGGLVVLLFFKRNEAIKKNIYKMPDDALHITKVDKGGVFKLSGVGQNSEELTLKVISKHLYQEGDFYWYELECDKGDDDKVWVEVEDDDETKVSIVLEKLKLKDINTSPEELASIDDEEEGSVRFRGVTYNYDESDEAIFYRHCDNEKPEKFYYWDFVSKNYSISVEKWGDKEYLVYYSQLMRPSQVSVLSNKTDSGV